MPKTQTDRVYDAEREFGFGAFFCGPDDAQQWIGGILKTRWWKRRCDVTEVRLTYGLSKKWAEARKVEGTGIIDVPRARLCEEFICHELAHLIAWPAGFDHQPAFIRTFLEVVGYCMMKGEKKRMRKLLEKHGAKMR